MTATAYLWCGAPTPTSLRPAFVLDGPATTVRGAFSQREDMSDATFTGPVAPDADRACQPGAAVGLRPDTRYYYCAEIDGVLDTANIGRARTLSLRPRAVEVTFGSCWAAPDQAGAHLPDHAVGGAIAAKHADGASLHMFLGDLGYPNISNNDPARFRLNYAKMHAIPAFATLARSCAWDVSWDDHDFGPDNSNGAFVGKGAAASVYRQCVPHPSPLPDSQGAIYRAYDLTPDIRVVVTDVRYYRTPDTAPDDANKTMLGAEQKAWLKQEWLAAKQRGQLILWGNTQVWCIDGTYATSGLNTDRDHWGAFSTERAELDNFRAAHGITDMVILSGDAHMIAYRNGVDYSDDQTVPTPVYVAAAYARTPAYRPAAWEQNSPPSEGDGHYGLLRVRPRLGGWDVTCEFHLVDPDTGADAVSFQTSTRFGRHGLYAVDGHAVDIDGAPHLVQV